MGSPLCIKMQGKMSSFLIECGVAGVYSEGAYGEGRVPF